MKPYYDEDGIMIYCGDCREVLPQLTPVWDTVITDPVWPNADVHLAGSDDPRGLLQECLALIECQRMPRIADINERLPYESQASEQSVEFKSVKDWIEPYSSTANLHVYEDAEGHRRVVVEKIQQRA